MPQGLHRTKTGELVYVSITAGGRYMIKHANGEITIV